MDSSVTERIAPVRYEAAPLRNQIITSLRRAIETGILEPGLRLVEKDLCQQLNVSRTSLREALRQLEAEGILTNAKNRGLAVAKISLDDAANIYRIRGVLEALVVEQFIGNASDAQISALQEKSRLLKKAYRSGSAEDIVAAKRAFYDQICSGADNPIAFDIHNKLTLLTSWLRRQSVVRPERQRQSIIEIDALVDAIAHRDAPKAQAAIEEHVSNAAQSAFLALMPRAAGEEPEKPARRQPTRERPK